MYSRIRFGSSSESKKNISNPFIPLSEEEFYERLAMSRKQAETGHYRDADDVISEIKDKYEL